MTADPRMLAEIRIFLERQRLESTESEEQRCVKLCVRSGLQKAYVSVFNTGSLSVQGPESPLKTLLDQMKTALETGSAALGEVLPFETSGAKVIRYSAMTGSTAPVRRTMCRKPVAASAIAPDDRGRSHPGRHDSERSAQATATTSPRSST